jgi:hypothetical protein
LSSPLAQRGIDRNLSDRLKGPVGVWTAKHMRCIYLIQISSSGENDSLQLDGSSTTFLPRASTNHLILDPRVIALQRSSGSSGPPHDRHPELQERSPTSSSPSADASHDRDEETHQDEHKAGIHYRPPDRAQQPQDDPSYQSALLHGICMQLMQVLMVRIPSVFRPAR